MFTENEQKLDRDLAYSLFRVLLGVNLTLHGVSRILGGTASFAGELTSQFSKTILPQKLVYLFGLTLPYTEASIGVLLLLGIWSRYVYCAGFLLMIALTFGSSLKQDWTAAGWQLLYAFAYAALLAFRSHNVYKLPLEKPLHRHKCPLIKGKEQ